MWTGSRKVISSIPTVSATPPECLIAASAAAVSTRRMITPPWTFPATFASVTSIICVRVTSESDALRGLGADTRGILRGCRMCRRRADTIDPCGSWRVVRTCGGRVGRRSHDRGVRHGASGAAEPDGVTQREPERVALTQPGTVSEPRALGQPRARAGGDADVVRRRRLTPGAPPEDLVPEGADVTGEWFAFTDDGVMVVIAWVEPGSDFSRLPRGFAVWRRHGSAPYWRADLVRRHDAEDGIQELQITTADLTGDSSDDALVFEGAGGSGACGQLVRDRPRCGSR